MRLRLPATLFFLASLPGSAQMLVNTDWLSGRLGKPDLVILHVGGAQDYAAGHIPGALLVTLGDISVTGPGGLRLELPPLDRLRDAFARLGVGDGDRVVLYAGSASAQSATRVWFTLDYLGLGGRASLLDGGLAAWRSAGKPVTAEAAPARPKTLSVEAHPELVVDAGWLKSRLNGPGLRLLDARTPEFYSGASAGQMPRAGHIPGARNVPYTTLLDEQGKLLPAASLLERLGGKTRPGETLAVYCHIGQQATLLYFAARLAGLQPRLYDGSFQDWSGRGEGGFEVSPPHRLPQ